MTARSCAFCDCGGYDDADGRTRPDTGTPICWCGHTSDEHLRRACVMSRVGEIEARLAAVADDVVSDEAGYAMLVAAPGDLRWCLDRIKRARRFARYVGLLADYYERSPARWNELHAMDLPTMADYARALLRGKDLVCWCPLEDEHGNRVPCHADVLLRVSNGAGDS